MTQSLRVGRQSKWQAVPRDRRFASLEISVGNPSCMGEALTAQIDWARERFEWLQFSVGDTLNVHNYMSIGHPDYGVLNASEAHQRAFEEGNSWMLENVDRIAGRLPRGSYEIRRWDDWLAMSEVRACIASMVQLFRQNFGLEELLVRERLEYLRRRAIAVESLSSGDLQSLSRYVLEELAVFQYQGAQKTCVHLYPGDLAILRRMKNLPGCPPALKEAQYVLFDVRAI